MGHASIKQSQAVATPQPTMSLTLRSAEDLITAVAKALHPVMKRYRRDRWWFLKGQRRQPPPQTPAGHVWSSPPQSHDLRTQVIGTHTLFWGEAPGLSCTIRASWYGGGRPPMIVVEFRQGRGESLTVKVGLHGERRRDGWLRGEAIKAMPPRERQALRKSYVDGMRSVSAQRALAPKEALKDRRLWWIDPVRTPPEATRFVLILYLWQVGMISLAPGQASWTSVKKFIRSKDDAQLYLILQRMRTRYALPQHWKGLRVYIGKVIRGLAAQKAGQRNAIAAHYGISRSTFYRWISEGRVPRNGKAPLDKRGWAAVQQLAGQRALRREAMRMLTENKGKSVEAARKLVYRDLKAEKSLETMVRGLRRGEMP